MSNFGLSIRLLIEPLRSLAFGSITSTYVPIGTAMINAGRQFLIQNTTDVLLYFSIDGVNDHIALPPNGFLINDITSNKTRESGFYLAVNTIWYVRAPGSSPSMGSAYVTIFYATQE